MPVEQVLDGEQSGEPPVRCHDGGCDDPFDGETGTHVAQGVVAGDHHGSDVITSATASPAPGGSWASTTPITVAFASSTGKSR